MLVLIIYLKEFLTNKGLLTEKKSLEVITSDIQKDVTHIGDFEEPHEHNDTKEGVDPVVLEKNRNPTYVTELLFGSATLKEKDIFSSAFDFETLNKDLFSVEEENKEKVLVEMMSRISRQNTLIDINVLTVERIEEKGVYEVKVSLFYKDEIKKTVILELIAMESFHEGEEGVLSVLTSVWDLIKQIER